MDENMYNIVLKHLMRWDPCHLSSADSRRYCMFAAEVVNQLKTDSSIDEISWVLQRQFKILCGFHAPDRTRCNEYATYIWLKMQAA